MRMSQIEMAMPMIFSQKPKNDKKPKLVEFCPILVSMTLKGFQKHVEKLRPKFGDLRCLSSFLVLDTSFELFLCGLQFPSGELIKLLIVPGHPPLKVQISIGLFQLLL